MAGRRQDVMKATTVRFGPDLWALLEAEAARVGVSVSQYIREAALARAAFAAGARADLPSDLLTRWVLTGVRPEAVEDRDEAVAQLVAVLQSFARANGSRG
jgi:hypothetical protein